MLINMLIYASNRQVVNNPLGLKRAHSHLLLSLSTSLAQRTLANYNYCILSPATMKNWKRKIFKTFAKGKAKDPDPRSAQLPCPPPNLEATYRSELGRLDGGNGVTLDLSPIDLGFGDLSFNGDPAGDARPNNADTENVGPNEVRPGLPDLMAAMTLPSVLETKMILREDGLLDVNLQDSDPRAAM